MLYFCMVFWSKKKGYVDLSDRMMSNQERINRFKENSKSESVPSQTEEVPFPAFFDSSSSGETQSYNSDSDEKKKKLAKRLIDMTNRIEDLENQIYQLKQRIEVLERKERIGY